MNNLDAADSDTRTRITNLLAWAQTRGIRIDPRLHIVPGTSADSSHSAGITVVARAAIPPDTTLVRIPASAVLSTRSSPLAAHLPPGDALQSQQLGLALALHYELSVPAAILNPEYHLRGSASPWAPYLASLPREPVPIALFWGDRDAASYTGHAHANTGDGDISEEEKAEVELRVQDSLAAAAWLAGTEVEREVLRTPVAEIRAYYIHTARPLLARRAGAGTGAGTLGAFYHAYALVSSRAFLVDAYHGLAMVPIADAFNHDQENHVQLESDYDVCPRCGAVDECPHDADDDDMDAEMEMADADVDADMDMDADTGGSASGNAVDAATDRGDASAATRADGAAGNADVDADVDKRKPQSANTSATRAGGGAHIANIAVDVNGGVGGRPGDTSATRADGAATSRAGCGNGAAPSDDGAIDHKASSTSSSVRAGAASATLHGSGRAPAASGSAIPPSSPPSATAVYAEDEELQKAQAQDSLDAYASIAINAIMLSAPPPPAPPGLESAAGASASPPGFAFAFAPAPARADASIAETEISPPPAHPGFALPAEVDCDRDCRDPSTSARATPRAARAHGPASGVPSAVRGPSGRAGAAAICNSEDEGGEKDEDINFNVMNVMLSVPSRPPTRDPESARVRGFAPSSSDFNFVDNASPSALPGSAAALAPNSSRGASYGGGGDGADFGLEDNARFGSGSAVAGDAHAANSSRGASGEQDGNDNVPMLMSSASAADVNFEDNASALAVAGDAANESRRVFYEENDNDSDHMLMLMSTSAGADYTFEDNAAAANNSRSYETDDYDHGDADDSMSLSSSTPECTSAAGPPTIPRRRRSFSYSSADNAHPIAADASPLNPPNTVAFDAAHGGASYEMVSTAWIPPAAEVMNTYGGALGNGALLAQYGFALAANERDAVVFTWADCVRAAARGGTGAADAWAGGFEAYAGVARAWAAAVAATLWDGSGLVYARRGGYGGAEGDWQGRVNADGRICEGLWVFCALAVGGISGSSDVVAQLGALAGQQLALEGDDCESDGEDPERQPSRRPDRVEAVGRVVRTVVDLCDSRRTQLIGHTDLAAALDATPPHGARTRAAIEQRLGEVSLLDCAVAGWRAIDCQAL